MKYEPGMMAKSMAGHDRDRIYVIVKEDVTCVYLADGRARTIDRPKKKKKKHVQLICAVPQELIERFQKGEVVRDEEIKRVIGGIAHV